MISLFRLKACVPAMAAAASLMFALGAHAASQQGPVSLVVPYPAGGGSDITARIVAPALARQLGATVVVENVGGATGAIAVQKVLSAAADGHLLYQGSQNELIIPPLTVKSVPFGPADLEIVHPITTTRLVLVVRRDLPAKTLDEFIALTRQTKGAEPLSYGSPGVGSLYHLVAEHMAQLSGGRYTHVPYKGAAPMMQDLIGGRLDFTVMAFSTGMLAAEKAGQYRIIANMSKDKPEQLAGLPSISEAELFKTVDYASNAAYYVKKGTPSAIRLELNRALGQALSSADVTSALEADGRRVPKAMSVAQAEAFYQAEIDKYRRVVADTGFKPAE